jgi:hypothetical protein
LFEKDFLNSNILIIKPQGIVIAEIG